MQNVRPESTTEMVLREAMFRPENTHTPARDRAGTKVLRQTNLAITRKREHVHWRKLTERRKRKRTGISNTDPTGCLCSHHTEGDSDAATLRSRCTLEAKLEGLAHRSRMRQQEEREK